MSGCQSPAAPSAIADQSEDPDRHKPAGIVPEGEPTMKTIDEIRRNAEWKAWVNANPRAVTDPETGNKYINS